MGGKWNRWNNVITDDSGKQLKSYTQWVGMYNRCGKAKAYLDVSMSNKFKNYDSWLDWAKDQKGFLNKEDSGRIWNMDKDLLGDGKEYNENVCVFIPHVLNNFAKYTPTGDLPRGVRKTGKYAYIVKIKKFNKFYLFNGYKTPEEAFEKFMMERIDYLNQLADIYYHHVDDRVFPALRDKMFCPLLNNSSGIEY